MSVKVMSTVFESSRQRDSTMRLLLLALADHASDDGVCWPGIARIAAKTAKSERHIKRLLPRLEASGELFIDYRRGRGNTNQYLITIGLTESEIKSTLIHRFDFPPEEACRLAHEVVLKRDHYVTFLEPEKVTPRAGKGDTQGKKVTPRAGKGDIAMSPEPLEPSINHQEPSLKRTDKHRAGVLSALADYEARAHDEPWRGWGGESNEVRKWRRADVPRDALLQLGYLLEHEFRLAPIWSDRNDTKSWLAGLAALYLIAGGDHTLVRLAYRELMDDGMTVSTPRSLMNKTRALKANGGQPLSKKGKHGITKTGDRGSGPGRDYEGYTKEERDALTAQQRAALEEHQRKRAAV